MGIIQQGYGGGAQQAHYESKLFKKLGVGVKVIALLVVICPIALTFVVKS